MHTQRNLPQNYVLIDKSRHEQLRTTEFNPAEDGYESANRLSDRFVDEIHQIKVACSEFLAIHGEFGSVDRYVKQLPSDWWIDDDVFSVSRVLFIELLDSRMQTCTVVEGLRSVLHRLRADWMLMVGHDNAYDNRGQFVGKPGSYYFWIRKETVEIYSETPEDLETYYSSLDCDAA